MSSTDEDIYKSAERVLREYDYQTLELECRVGTCSSKGFYSSISKNDFNAMLKAFKSHFGNNRGYYFTQTYDITCDSKRVSIEASSGKVEEVIEKRNKRNFDFETAHQYYLRLTAASEVDVTKHSRNVVENVLKLFQPVHPWQYMQQRGVMRIQDGVGVQKNLTSLLWMYVGDCSQTIPQQVTMMNYAGFCRDGMPASQCQYTVKVSPQCCTPVCPFSRFPQVPFSMARYKSRTTFTLRPGITMSFTIAFSTVNSLVDLHMPNANTMYEVEYEVLPRLAIPDFYNLYGHDVHLVTIFNNNTENFLKHMRRIAFNVRIHVFKVDNKIKNIWGSLRCWLARHLDPDDIIISHDSNYIFNTDVLKHIDNVEDSHLTIVGHLTLMQTAKTVHMVPRKRVRFDAEMTNLSTMTTYKSKKDPDTRTATHWIRVTSYCFKGMVSVFKALKDREDDRVVKKNIAKVFARDVCGIFSRHTTLSFKQSS